MDQAQSPNKSGPPSRLLNQPFRFTPVPRQKDRADGWSSDRQHAFVWALARMPSVAVAARGVGMTARSAYRLRKAAGAEDFARAWDIAWQMGIDHVRDLAIERGLNGQDYPIHRRGRVVGKIHRCDNRLLLRTLTLLDREDAMPRRIAAARRLGV